MATFHCKRGGVPDEEILAAIAATLELLLGSRAEPASAQPQPSAWGLAGRLDSHTRRNPTWGMGRRRGVARNISTTL